MVRERDADGVTKITYGLTETIYRSGSETRTAYGIAVYDDARRDGTSTVVECLNDVGSDRRKVAELVQTCNRLGLSEVHLREVVEDLLTD